MGFLKKKSLGEMKSIKKFRSIVKSLIDATYDLDKASPQFCACLLRLPNDRALTKLRQKIRKSDQQWIKEFIINDGLFSLLMTIEIIMKKYRNNLFVSSILVYKSLACIKEIMNLEYGMQSIINLGDHNSCIEIMAKG